MKTINFRIISKQNREIYQTGYVEVPDDLQEPSEWFYFDPTGMAQPREFTHHDGVGLTATDAQYFEMEQFEESVHYKLVDYVNDVILNAEEDEHETYEKGDLIIKINEE